MTRRRNADRRSARGPGERWSLDELYDVPSFRAEHGRLRCEERSDQDTGDREEEARR